MKPGEIHTVPCPIAGGSWAGVERAVVETVIEQMNHHEQLRRVRVAKEEEAARKAESERLKIDLGKPMRIRRPWHKEKGAP